MSYLLKGKTGNWEVIVGLEVHAQVKSKTKLFSSATTEFGEKPNSQVSLVDAAMPGMLPVINEFCISQAVKSGLGLRAKINHYSVFERKNYFYADLPQGYQISQYLFPIVGEGAISIEINEGVKREIGIERLHLEQDAGKSMHDKDPDYSLIDLNRAGICLMEIVSKPDLRSPEEAGAYVTKLRSILRYLDTCDGNMEEGSLRADVNVSVRKVGEQTYRTRTETKNLNSVRFIKQAIEIEAFRQIEVWERGSSVIQETRLFDPEKLETRAMRTKEFAHDYRYFPDPDLLPLRLTQEFIDKIKAEVPELPEEKENRFVNDFGLSRYDARVIVAEYETAKYFESVVEGRDGKKVANWITGSLFGALNKSGLTIDNTPIGAENLGNLVDLVEEGVISGRIAKEVFEIMFVSGKNPRLIVEEKNLKQIKNPEMLEPIIERIISDNPSQSAEVRNGNEKAIGWFVGQVMKETKGSANPNLVNQLLRQKLGVK